MISFLLALILFQSPEPHQSPEDRARLLMESGQPSEAADVLLEYLASLDESKYSTLSKPRLLSSLSVALLKSDRLEEAEIYARHGLQLLHDSTPLEQASFSRVLSELSLNKGMLQEAALFARDYARLTGEVFSRSPDTASAFEFSAAINRQAGDLKQAESDLETAIAIRESLPGAGGFESLGSAIGAFSDVLEEQGKVEAAIGLREYALDILAESSALGEQQGLNWIDRHLQLLSLLGDTAAAATLLDRFAPFLTPAYVFSRMLDMGWLAGMTESSSLWGNSESYGSPLNGAIVSSLLSEDGWEKKARTVIHDFENQTEGSSISTGIEMLKTLLIASESKEKGPEWELSELLKLFSLHREELGDSNPLQIGLLVKGAKAAISADMHPELLDIAEFSMGAMADSPLPFLILKRRSFRLTTGQDLFNVLNESWCRIAAWRSNRLLEAFSSFEQIRAQRIEVARAPWSSNSDIFSSINTVDLSTLRKTLDQRRSAALYFVWGNEHLYCLTLSPDSSKDKIVKVGKTHELLPLLQTIFDATDRNQSLSATDKLEKFILRSIPSYLTESDRLVILSESLLSLFPFESIILPTGKRWGAKTRFFYAPSAAFYCMSINSVNTTESRVGDNVELNFSGEVPVSGIAERALARFPSVLAEIFSPSVQFTKEKQRTRFAYCESEFRAMKDASLGSLRFDCPLLIDGERPAVSGFAIGEYKDNSAGWRHPTGFLTLGEIDYFAPTAERFELSNLHILFPDSGTLPDLSGFVSILYSLANTSAAPIVVGLPINNMANSPQERTRHSFSF